MSGSGLLRPLVLLAAPAGHTGEVNMARRLLLLGSLVASTLLTLSLGVTDATGEFYYPTRFLVWNLTLAWIPLLLALGFAAARRPWAQALLGITWLVFLPNAPYLITDLVHIEGRTELWRHVLQLGFAAWTGTLLGVVSLRMVHTRVEHQWGQIAGWVVVLVSVVLCAIGVVIGRFQRLNSWDLLTRPWAVAGSTLEWMRFPTANPRSSGVAVAVGAFFGLAYLTVWALDGLSAGPDRSKSVRSK